MRTLQALARAYQALPSSTSSDAAAASRQQLLLRCVPALLRPLRLGLSPGAPPLRQASPRAVVTALVALSHLPGAVQVSGRPLALVTRTCSLASACPAPLLPPGAHP